jgi:hypothetical protein
MKQNEFAPILVVSLVVLVAAIGGVVFTTFPSFGQKTVSISSPSPSTLESAHKENISVSSAPAPIKPGETIPVRPSSSPAASSDISAKPSNITSPAPSATPQTSEKTYTHSADSDLGQNAFTISGGQHSESSSGGVIHLKVSGTFTIHSYIKNFGTGMAANVPYVWYDNDKIIKQGIIDHLAPGAETTVNMSFNSANYSGEHKHRFVINPDHTVPEKTYTTNEGWNPWFVEPF